MNNLTHLTSLMVMEMLDNALIQRIYSLHKLVTTSKHKGDKL